MNSFRSALGTLTCGLLTVAACTDAPDPTQPGTDPEPAAPEQVAGDASFDANALAQDIPGFGGFFIDANGVATVRLIDPDQRAAAERILGPRLRSLDAGPSLRIIKADYTAAQLNTWVQQAVPEVLGLPGVVLVDNDEERNRLLVGVKTRTAEPAVRGAMARIGVQRDAVIVEEMGPIVEAASLRDQVRPLLGGLQIGWIKTLFGIKMGKVCTLGFNAINPPSTRQSFITNSHCTQTRASTSSPTKFFQPNAPLVSSSLVPIGTEVEDRPFWSLWLLPLTACPAMRRCRWSDAARVNYNSGLVPRRGRLARTSESGSRTIVGEWTITEEDGSPVVGVTFHKVGRTTGWSSGRVTNTCAFAPVEDTTIILMCQDIVKAKVDGGDSGSPVFSRSFVNPSSTNVKLRGILWGSQIRDGATHFVMSSIKMIEREMGPLTTH